MQALGMSYQMQGSCASDFEGSVEMEPLGKPLIMKQHNLHRSLKFIFVIAQVFGFFPVQGVLEDEVSRLGFSWKSVRVFSSIITALAGTVVTLGHIRHITVIDGYQQHQMSKIFGGLVLPV
jgi:hypothetical protein